MSIEKRPRGRPRGSGKNDSRHLAQVADLLVREPSLTPTAAMRRIMRSCKDWDAASEPALIHRWQEKWKVNGVSLLAAAHERARPRPPAVQLSWMEIWDMMKPIRDMQDSPTIKAIGDLQDSWQQTIRNLHPMIKAIRDLLDSWQQLQLRASFRYQGK